MFFFVLPWGHDQPVYERPWLTYALIAICTIVFAGTWSMESRADAELEVAVAHAETVLDSHPDARVHLTFGGAPRAIDELLSTLVTDDPHRPAKAGDADLELAVREMIAAINRMPAFRFGFQPGAPRVDRALAHMFVHADLMHLLGNMLFLWLAGGVLECFWRRWAYVALYVASGLAGIAVHVLASPHSLVPVVGASGAIAGLLGAFVVGYPRTRIKLLWFGLLFFQPLFGNWKVPAWVLIPLWAGIELVSGWLGGEDSGVAHWVHVGGFAFGALLALALRRTSLIATDVGRIEDREPGPSVATTPSPALRLAPIPAPAKRGAPAERRVSTPVVSAHAPAPLSRPPPPEEIDALPAARDDDVIER